MRVRPADPQRDAARVAETRVALHEAIGMSLVGVCRRVGYKLGQWRDVAWYEMRLADTADGAPPDEPARLSRPRALPVGRG